MNALPLDILNNAPDFSTAAILTIEALAPLSLVVQMPGKYYRSQSAPSNPMLYGLLENALGWHFGDKDRTEILKAVQKMHKLPGKTAASGVGFQSLLQFHLKFGVSISPANESLLRYDDLWSQHLRTGGEEFFGGSREYDARVIPLVNAVAAKDSNIKVNDRSGGRRDEEAITDFKENDTISLTVVRPYFPRYYASPTPREYIEPCVAYRWRLETSLIIAEGLQAALNDPIAPLYLGNNDGWVDASFALIGEPL